jgi:hypothetical protein
MKLMSKSKKAPSKKVKSKKAPSKKPKRKKAPSKKIAAKEMRKTLADPHDLLFERLDRALDEDAQSLVEAILKQDPGEAGYELAGLFYTYLEHRESEESRKRLSWLKISLFPTIEQISQWDDVEKGIFLISFALRWKRGHEALKKEFRIMLEKLEKLENEIEKASRYNSKPQYIFPAKD